MTTYIICGPTSSGKSALALDIARHEKGSIINADSMQVYKELPILSAQPSLKDQETIPHFLYGYVSVREPSSVGKWLQSADGVLKNNPISCALFVGGTGLYLKSLMEGLSPIPDIPLSLREELAALLGNTSREHLLNLLKKEDPGAGEKIDPHNTQRILRALEVVRHTGKSILEWQEVKKEKVVSLSSPLKVILIDPDRESLYQTINQRVRTMVDRGAIEEVKALQQKGVVPSLTASKTLGYEEISAYLNKDLSKEEMIEQIQQKTRQYAKRQLTWFRHQINPDFIWPKIYGSTQWSLFLSERESKEDRHTPLLGPL